MKDKEMDDDEIEVKMPKMKPMLHCEGDDCVDGAEIGKEATLMVRAKLVGINQDEYDGKSTMRQRWEIQGMKKAPKADIDIESFARHAQQKGKM